MVGFLTKSIKTRKRLFLGLNVLLVAGIIAAAVYALLPIDSDAKKSSRKPLPETNTSVIKKIAKNYDAIYGRPLRSSLTPELQVAPEIAGVPVAAVKSLNLQLLGTVVEDGHTYGLFRGSDGREKLAGPGKKIDSAEVVKVDEKSATVKHNGKLVILKIIKQPVANAAAPNTSHNSNDRTTGSYRRSRRRSR